MSINVPLGSLVYNTVFNEDNDAVTEQTEAGQQDLQAQFPLLKIPAVG